MDPNLQLLLEGDADEEVEVIVRLHRPDAVPPGLRVVAQFGSILTCRLRRGSIDPVRRDERVASMKAPTLLIPGEDPTVSAAEADFAPSFDSDLRRPADPATGHGVLVAVIDWGIAVDHPDFRHPEGQTRLLALWDQSTPYDPRRPNRYGYGVIHSAADIDAALRTPRPDVALNYFWERSDVGSAGSHGSHVTGIAAGNGRSGGPLGVAPDASLVFVQLVSKGIPNRANLATSVSLLEAVDFVLRTAGDRPVCINMSMGRCMGPHDGKTLVELALDTALNDAPGRAIFFSGGNYFTRRGHSSGQLLPGQRVTIPLLVSEADVTPNELEVWYSGRDVMTVQVSGPAGVSKRTGLDDRASIQVGGKEVCRVFHRARDPNNLDNQIQVYLFAGAPAGAWELTLTGDDIVDGHYNVWIERDAGCLGCQARFADRYVVPLGTTGTICNGSRTIAVGAYNNHDPDRSVASFSSSGPTRDWRVKPELLAPGVQVLSARSTVPGREEPPDYLTRKSGTSMAAPHVTGTVALMFEVAGRPLHIQETRSLLLGSASPTDARGNDRHRVGSGYLDIDAALALTRAHVADGGPGEVRAVPYRSNGSRPSGPDFPTREPRGEAMNGESTGSALVELAEAAIGADQLQGRRGLLGWLAELIGQPAALASASGGDQMAAGTLFDAMATLRRPADRERLSAAFELVAIPGEPLATQPQPGDLLVRRATGDGRLGHVAVIAGPDILVRDQAQATGWRLEGTRSGGYVLVVEAGPNPRLRADRFARRLLDPGGRLPLDTTILRVQHMPGPSESVAEQAAPAPPVVAGPDSPVADRFVAAHASRWCSPGDTSSATCRQLRAPRVIRRVVIHALAVPSTSRRTGAQAVVLGWQRAGRTASAHYIIDRDGTTTQMVREADVAFHAGPMNRDSIGIEHADVCNDPTPLTRELYERSAALVRDIARRHGFTPSVFGVDTAALATSTVSGHVHHSGSGGHSDPGPYWDWQYYAHLVRWDGSTENTRPVREVATTANPAVTPRPTGWSTQSRRAIANDRCASYSDPYGVAYWRAQPGARGAPVVFTLSVAAPGTYQVSLWWPRVKGANSATPVEVQVGSGTPTALTVDQRRNHGRWVDIGGELTVPASTTVTVRILRTSTEPGWILADAVRLLRLRSTP